MQGSRADRHAGARQDACRRRGIGDPRHGGGRVRDRHSASAEGRAQRQRRHRRRQLVGAHAGRRLRGHYAVQFSGDGADVDVSDRDRMRKHVRPEAVGARSDAVAAARRVAAGGRAARRRLQRRARRQGGGRRAARASGGPRRFVRRLDADREVHLRNRRAQRQARAGAGRREEPCGGHAGRRSRLRNRSDHRRGLWIGGRALHGDLGGRRGGRRRRFAGRQARGARAAGDDRAGRRRRTSKWVRSSPAQRATGSRA